MSMEAFHGDSSYLHTNDIIFFITGNCIKFLEMSGLREFQLANVHGKTYTGTCQTTTGSGVTSRHCS